MNSTARTVSPPVRRVRWSQTYRIIPTRYPPVPLFERLGDPADWEVLSEIESLTNPRARDELGEIALVPPNERVAGPGASFVMAPFVHRRPSRFSDGSYGVYYAAHKRSTAIAETRHHMARFYAATAEPPLDFDMRTLVAALDERLHDLRGKGRGFGSVLDPDDYRPAQALGAALHGDGSRGLVYPSVRDTSGQCIAAFSPRVIGLPRSIGTLRYHWDGTTIARVFDYATETWL